VNCLRSRSPIEPRWRTPSSCPGEAGTAQIGISACAWPCGLTTSSLPNAKSLNMWIVVPVRLRCQFQPVGRVGGIQVNRSMRWRSENPVSGFRLTFPFTHRPGRERDVIGNASRPGIGKANFAVVFSVRFNSEHFDGRNLALRLAALGYTRVRWYRGGREAWEVAHLHETELPFKSGEGVAPNRSVSGTLTRDMQPVWHAYRCCRSGVQCGGVGRRRDQVSAGADASRLVVGRCR
jgi:hypothetical protein